jgi:hypothetical protein
MCALSDIVILIIDFKYYLGEIMATKKVRYFPLVGYSLMFGNERNCKDKLFEMKLSNGFLCPHCGTAKYFTIPTLRTIECKVCKHQTSLTAGSIVHKKRAKPVILDRDGMYKLAGMTSLVVTRV